MQSIRVLISVALLLLYVDSTNASTKCVWAVGKVECKNTPGVLQHTEIRLLDHDGRGGSAIRAIDPDDLMG